MLKDLLEKLEQEISFTEAKNCDPDVFVVNAEELKEKIDKELKNEGWHLIEEGTPQPNVPVLVSFANNGNVAIGRYIEDGQWGGAFYMTDGQMLKFLHFGLIVNAWMELPGCYRETPERKRLRDEILNDFMKKARI